MEISTQLKPFSFIHSSGRQVLHTRPSLRFQAPGEERGGGRTKRQCIYRGLCTWGRPTTAPHITCYVLLCATSCSQYFICGNSFKSSQEPMVQKELSFPFHKQARGSVWIGDQAFGDSFSEEWEGSWGLREFRGVWDLGRPK